MQKVTKQVLSTRPLSRKLIDEAAAYNILFDEISFIETRPVKEQKVSDKIEHYRQQNITAIFTSMNAVDAVIKQLKSPTAWKIYCIGNTTRNLVADYFGNNSIAGTASNADKLADIIISDKIHDTLFFCGDQRRDELPKKLQQHNITIEEIVVYNTIETPVLITKKYNGILFFSPSAADSFFSINKISNETLLFAIGATTAKAIQQYNANNVVISDLPGKENLVKKMIEYYNTNKCNSSS